MIIIDSALLLYDTHSAFGVRVNALAKTFHRRDAMFMPLRDSKKYILGFASEPASYVINLWIP